MRCIDEAITSSNCLGEGSQPTEVQFFDSEPYARISFGRFCLLEVMWRYFLRNLLKTPSFKKVRLGFSVSEVQCESGDFLILNSGKISDRIEVICETLRRRLLFYYWN